MTNTNSTSRVHPTNAIVKDNTGIRVTSAEVENATNMYAGRLVIQGTDDDDITVCGAGGDAVGWLGYEQTAKKWRPATVDTIYTATAKAAVIWGPGIVLVASLKSGENVVKGARLCAAASGEVEAADTMATQSGTTAVVGHAAQPAVIGGIASQNIVVAIAEESKDASSGALDILVRSLI